VACLRRACPGVSLRAGRPDARGLRGRLLHVVAGQGVATLEEVIGQVEASRVRPSPTSWKIQLLQYHAAGLALGRKGLDDELRGAHLVEEPW